MAVKRCPSCGDLYLAAVDVCADCGTALIEVEEEGADDGAGSDEAGVTRSQTGEHAVWELDSWTMEGRRLLDGMLASAEIPRVWQGASVLAPRAVKDQVEEMVTTVARGDARVGIDDDTLAAADAGVVGAEAVGYEVSDWTDEALDRLEERLTAAEIPYGWDEDGDLVVAAQHEAAVDALFADLTGGVDAGDALDPDEGDDGPEALETLSEMFFAADNLARNPLDGNAARSLAAAVARAGGYRLPFGFPPKVWDDILDRATRLGDLIDTVDHDDDQVEADAADLRAVLRDYV